MSEKSQKYGVQMKQLRIIDARKELNMLTKDKALPVASCRSSTAALSLLKAGESMNYVEPIRDPEKVKHICTYLKETNYRNFIMFYLGIYSGLRISDILQLRVADVKNKSNINIREKKTGKQKIYAINPALKKELSAYCEGKPLSEYLIKSREGENRPLSRERAYQIIKEIGELFGIPDLGTHTLRKTFGYHYYLQYKDVVMLQKIFNHASPAITLKYIGYEQEKIDRSIKNFKIF